MIRLQLKPSILKRLNFNRKNNALEIEFKKNIKTAKHIEIPLSIIQEYISSIKENILYEDIDYYQSNLKVVHSKFKP